MISVSMILFRKILIDLKISRRIYQWVPPTGYDTGIQIYNRVVKQKVPLIFVNKNLVKWYICGPTVYDDSHIGHASCYIRFDIIRRILEEFFDIKPVIALGITDIDDKIISRAKFLNTDFKSLSKNYELDFFNQLNDLNILPPSFVLRVSDHIPEIINFIEKIVEYGHGYVAPDGSVYFDTRASSNYGKLVSLPEEGKINNLKVGQKYFMDFVLWKAAKPNEPFWESPWGKGRPGWHIECSAMASKVFGSQLDLHSGGNDLVFPHHENEESQSCSYHNCSQWVNYWFHAGQLQIQMEKMSKSLKNFISISDFLKNNKSDHLRMMCFVSQYHKALHYSPDSVNFAATACDRISDFLSSTNAYVKGNWGMGRISESDLLQELNNTSTDVKKFLRDDFNTAGCYTSLVALMKKTLRMLNEEKNETESRSPGVVAAVSRYVEEIFRSFGFQLTTSAEDKMKNQMTLDFILEAAINFRNDVRQRALSCSDKSMKKNLLKSCDSFRNELNTVDIKIKDYGKGSSL